MAMTSAQSRMAFVDGFMGPPLPERRPRIKGSRHGGQSVLVTSPFGDA
jgi:hypothetical protein